VGKGVMKVRDGMQLHDSIIPTHRVPVSSQFHGGIYCLGRTHSLPGSTPVCLGIPRLATLAYLARQRIEYQAFYYSLKFTDCST
jgi:hypothetical protein